MAELVLLMTDVEGSTLLWESEPDAMAVALDLHDSVICGAVDRHGGEVVRTKGEGDSTFSTSGGRDGRGDVVAAQRRVVVRRARESDRTAAGRGRDREGSPRRIR